jgi:hypothetical protein
MSKTLAVICLNGSGEGGQQIAKRQVSHLVVLTDAWRQSGSGIRRANHRRADPLLKLFGNRPPDVEPISDSLWYRARTTDSRSGTRNAMIVALARKLIIGALALCHDWRTTGGRRFTSSVLEGAYRNEHPLSTIFGARAGFSTTAELTIRGGGKPYSNLALDADRLGLRIDRQNASVP